MTSNPVKQALATINSLSPTRLFFRTSDHIKNISQARQVFKTLGDYGDMVEYKVMRCPETMKYLRWGFVVYKHRADADRALEEQFVRIAPSEAFDKPIEIKIEKSDAQNTFKNNRQNNDPKQPHDRAQNGYRKYSK